MKPIFRRTWFRLLAGVVVLLLVFITFLPYGVQYGIERWYLEQGADQVLIDDIDINLFTGKLHIYDFKALRSDKVLMEFDSADLELEWLPLFKKRALLSRLHINGLHTDITQQPNGQISIAGIEPDGADKKASSWGIGLQGITISNTLLTVVMPEQQFKVGINAIVLDHIESWSVDQSHIKFNGEINNAPVVLDGQFNAFSRHPLFEGILSVKTMDLGQLSFFARNQVQTLKGKIDLNAEFRLARTNDKTFTLKSDTNLVLKRLAVANESMNVTTDKLTTHGNIDVSWKQGAVISKLVFNGRINTENTDINYDNVYLYHHDQFQWKGAVNSDSQQAPYRLSGTVSAGGIRVDDRTSFIELFKASQLSINQLTASSDLTARVDDLSIDNFTVLLAKNPVDQTPLLQAQKLIVNHTDYSQTQLVIDEATVQQALIDIDRQSDGRIRQLALLDKKTSSSSRTTTTASEQHNQSLGVKITRLGLTPGSKIRFNDASVKPTYHTELNIQKAAITQIDSSTPKTASPVEIKAKQDKYSSIAIEGSIKPFSKPVDVDLQANIKNLSLPPLSSYSASIIGYDMVSGQLNTDSSITIKNGEIDAVNKIRINNLEIKSSDSEKSGELNKELNMPLESALSLLRDKDNDIKLNLPVSGNLNNPDFDISGVINKALGSALKKSSLAYLTFALQPYGSLIAIASLAKDAANQINLNPVYFSHGSSELNQTALDYVSKLSSVLTERPQLRIKLCGHATPDDRAAFSRAQTKPGSTITSPADPGQTDSNINKKLQELANSRAEAVKDSLTNTHKIEASRLFICKPEIDKDSDSKPRVVITL